MSDPAHRRSQTRRYPRSSPPGFTLIETVTALAISSLVIAAMGAAVMVATGSIPSTQARAATYAASQMDWIAIEVSEAESIQSATGSTLTFTTPDRSGDGQPELVSYTWSGTPGDPLNRTYNANAPEVVIPAIDAFVVSSVASTYSLGLAPDITRERINRLMVSMKISGSERALERMIALPNEPPVLDLFARTDFDSDPTLLDRDHSGSTDWYKYGTYDPNTIKKGWWNSSGSLGVRSPGALSVPTSAAGRVRIDSKGDVAQLDLVVEAASYKSANLRLTLTAGENDITADLQQMSSLTWTTLVTTKVNGHAVEFQVIVEPLSDTVTLQLNGSIVGSATYTRSGVGITGAALFGATGSSVYYDWIELRVGGVAK